MSVPKEIITVEGVPALGQVDSNIHAIEEAIKSLEKEMGIEKGDGSAVSGMNNSGFLDQDGTNKKQPKKKASK